MTDARAEHERRTFAARVSLLFGAIFVVAGANLPFFPVWLDWRGLGAREIAIITAVPLIVRVVVTPAVAFAADRAGDHRRFLIGLSWAGLAALLALSSQTGFWPILACTLAFALAWTTVMPLTETVALSGVRAGGLDYGRMRLWGSLSFIAASVIGGWVVSAAGAWSAIWLVIAGGLLTVLAAHALARPIGLGRLKAATTPPRLQVSDAIALLRSRVFLVFLLAAGATQAAHAMFYIFGTLHWAGQGISPGWSGGLWALGVVAEIAVFSCSGALVGRAGAPVLIGLGAAAAVVRWVAMGFDPPLAWLVPLQALHGLTFGAAHVGAIHYMAKTVPEGQTGTSQALYASVTGGIAMGAAMLASGPLYAAFAGQGYWAMAAIAAVGLGASIVLRAEGPAMTPQPQS
jgi:PPP family 3-phenylpropionic acid transporter